jgi:undecaprenyl-diphosphatase
MPSWRAAQDKEPGLIHLTFLEAGVVGLVQGISEMFPVSSLGHNVLIPAIVGGSWARDLNVAAPESPYLAFIVGLHVATAAALLVYFWRDWVRIIGGFFSSLRDRRVTTPDQKLAWMIIVATIPVGLVGVRFEHAFRVIFAKPILAAVFLTLNGLILIAGERYRTRASLAADTALAAGPVRAADLVADTAAPARDQHTELVAAGTAPSGSHQPGVPAGAQPRAGGAGDGPRTAAQPPATAAIESDRRLAGMGMTRALVIGSAQILALLAGISRDGVTMVAGMSRGLSRADAARFAFLLATPVILAAGALKIPDLAGPLSNGIRGQILFGSVLSGAGAYLSVRFLLRYLRTRTLTPFGIYCVIAGAACLVYLGLVK